jgi:hypothetical protein
MIDGFDLAGQTAGQQLPRREARAAMQALRGAVVISLVRAIPMPLLIGSSPPGTFPGADPLDIQAWGYTQAALFGVLAIWAARDPLPPTLVALGFYVAISIPDFVNQTGFLAQGWISKLVMLSILGRGVIAGMLHRSYLADQSI